MDMIVIRFGSIFKKNFRRRIACNGAEQRCFGDAVCQKRSFERQSIPAEC